MLYWTIPRKTPNWCAHQVDRHTHYLIFLISNDCHKNYWENESNIYHTRNSRYVGDRQWNCIHEFWVCSNRMASDMWHHRHITLPQMGLPNRLSKPSWKEWRSYQRGHLRLSYRDSCSSTNWLPSQQLGYHLQDLCSDDLSDHSCMDLLISCTIKSSRCMVTTSKRREEASNQEIQSYVRHPVQEMTWLTVAI